MENLTDLDLSDSSLSYEDISNRPQFKPEIDTSKTTISELIYEYNFSERHPCGKKDCHQPHSHGWVAVTDDGYETLIGSKCGLEWGGDSFILQKNKLSAIKKRNSQLKFFYETIDSAESVFDRIHEIKTRPHGANWLHKNKTRLQKECSQELFSILNQRASRGEHDVTIDTLRDKSEVELERAREPSKTPSLYKSELIGSFTGLEFFSYDLRHTLMDKIHSKLEHAQSLNPESLSTPKLNIINKELSQFENLFNDAEKIIELGNKFFASDTNFKLLSLLDKEKKHPHLIRLKW